jgi:hypothetical protein
MKVTTTLSSAAAISLVAGLSLPIAPAGAATVAGDTDATHISEIAYTLATDFIEIAADPGTDISGLDLRFGHPRRQRPGAGEYRHRARGHDGRRFRSRRRSTSRSRTPSRPVPPPTASTARAPSSSTRTASWSTSSRSAASSTARASPARRTPSPPHPSSARRPNRPVRLPPAASRSSSPATRGSRQPPPRTPCPTATGTTVETTMTTAKPPKASLRSPISRAPATPAPSRARP